MAKNTNEAVFEALEMCAFEGQDRAVRSVASSEVESIISDVLDEGAVVEQIQKAAMRAIAHPIIIQTVTNALLRETS